MESNEEAEWLPSGAVQKAPGPWPVIFGPTFVKLLGKQVLSDGSRTALKTGRPIAKRPGHTIKNHMDGEVVEGKRPRQNGKPPCTQPFQLTCHFVCTVSRFVASPAVLFKKKDPPGLTVSDQQRRVIRIRLLPEPHIVPMASSDPVEAAAWTGRSEAMNADRVKRAREKELERAARVASEAATLADICAQKEAAVELFDDTFNWEERKILMNAAYWSARFDHCVKAGTARGSVGKGIRVGARTARVHLSWHGMAG